MEFQSLCRRSSSVWVNVDSFVDEDDSVEDKLHVTSSTMISIFEEFHISPGFSRSISMAQAPARVTHYGTMKDPLAYGKCLLSPFI